jgi:hypothetical protein
MSRAKRRYYRTIFLGVLAMAALVWAAMDQFNIPAQEMQGLFLVTAAVLLGVIVVAGIFVLLLQGLRLLRRRNRGD